MIAFTRPSRRRRMPPAWHDQFVAMLPAILRHARLSFRHLPTEAREDAIAEVAANALVAFARLVELGKADVAYASPLARYGVAQVKTGRKVGGKLNCRDVLSPYCQQVKSLRVERLDRYDPEEECWQEVLVPDRHCTPAELAASRIDFPAWLATLKPRDRKIALKLATGERTQAVARRFRLSEGRISQLRGELKAAWERFQGEETKSEAATIA